MLAHPAISSREAVAAKPVVTLASSDPVLILDLEGIFHSLGWRFEAAASGNAAVAAIQSLETPGILLLDVRLFGVGNGQLLAAIYESGLRRRCAIALVAEHVSDDWIARLREGVIDDVVPRVSDAASWKMHVMTMQRGHQLFCELEQLRESSMMELQHDPVTGVFNRETILSILFRETDRVQRLRGTLCLVVLNVDGFAQWERELGLAGGEALLREIARRAGLALRSYDLLGRSGHEEFLLALPGCSTVNAVMLTERLRMEVFDDAFAVKTGSKEIRQVRLTGCFGITSSRGRSPVVVLREAEETAARAKQAGPGTIRCASDSPLSAESAFNSSFARLFPGPEVMV